VGSEDDYPEWPAELAHLADTFERERSSSPRGTLPNYILDTTCPRG